MSWSRYSRVSGYVGAVMLCGGCVARTCLAESRDRGGVETVEREPTPTDRGLTLRQVQVYFRHGARTPVRLIPNVEQATYREDLLKRDVPHTVFDVTLRCVDGGNLEVSPFERHYKKNPLKGGCYFGMLTPMGQQQMYELGQALRQDYMERSELLGPGYSSQEIYVRSTNINRTISSARCVMAGLFGTQQLDSAAAHIHVSNVDSEVLLPNPHNCQLVKTINHAALIHFDNIPGIKNDRIVLEKVLGVSSENPNKKLNFIDVRDDIVARQAHGLPLPSHLVPYLDMIEKNATKIMYHAGAGLHRAERNLALRMNAGPAISLAVEEMKLFVQGKSQRKMCLYSAHDSLLLPLTLILGIYDDRWPPFAADIRLELYTDERGEHWVRALYCGKVKKLNGCKDSFCRYSEFMSQVEPYLINTDQYNKICKSNILEKIAKDLLVHDKDEEKEERSDVPAGL